MLSIQQHKVMNEKYANETREWAVVQCRASADFMHIKKGDWTDYARVNIELAINSVKLKMQAEPGKWRVVDWITREEINLESFVRFASGEGDGASHLHTVTHQIPYPKQG